MIQTHITNLERCRKNLPIRAKLYVYSHIAVTLVIFFWVLRSDYSFSLPSLIPFIFFGIIFELLSLNVFTVKDQKLNLSAGSALILAAIILFNPLELLIFSAFYGFIIVLHPWSGNFYKISFNICQTINVTFVSYIGWIFLLHNTDNLLDSGNIPALLFAMFTFVIVDLLTVSIIIALASGNKLWVVFKESLDWIIVSYTMVAFIGLILAVVYKEFYIYGLIGFIAPLFLIQYNMRLFIKEKDKQYNQLLEFNELLKSNNDQLLMTLSQVIDARDNSLFGHSASVAKYALEFANKLGLEEEQVYDLRRGALLHDIGKLAIAESILHKPGKLTEEEFQIVKKHTVIGEKIISNVSGMERVAAIIGQHHEHYNGRGYPRGISGEEILIESRIVTLCDSLDTMLSTRSYKKGWTLEEAKTEILQCSGSHFDPAVVNAFLMVLEEKGDFFFTNSATLVRNDAVLEKLLITDTKLQSKL
jgi:putative nucleotidyltransferase with HDIG domain